MARLDFRIGPHYYSIHLEAEIGAVEKAARHPMTIYQPCRTCGRYVTAEDLHRGAWCSEECSRAFASCSNCGRFYVPRDGFDEEHCSRECATRYAIQRTYGPEPVRFLFDG